MYVLIGSGWTVKELKAALAENRATLTNSLSRLLTYIHTYIHTHTICEIMMTTYCDHPDLTIWRSTSNNKFDDSESSHHL